MPRGHETTYRIARLPYRYHYVVLRNLWDAGEGEYRGWRVATGRVFKSRESARQWVVTDLYGPPEQEEIP